MILSHMPAGVKAVKTSKGDFLTKLSLLQELELRQCGLQEIGTEVCSLTQLQKIDVSSNAISEVIQLKPASKTLEKGI